MKHTLLALFCILALTACAPATATMPTPSTIPAATLPAQNPTAAPTLQPTSGGAGLTLDLLKNATYTLSAGNKLQVTLKDGKFQVDDPAQNLKVSGQLVEPAALGDLDGDGLTDAVVILAANYGGSGTFFEMIVVLAQKGQAASLTLGDRIQVKQFSLQDGVITLDYLRQGPNDPMCCPSQHAVTRYQFKAGGLLKMDDQVVQ